MIIDSLFNDHVYNVYFVYLMHKRLKAVALNFETFSQ